MITKNAALAKVILKNNALIVKYALEKGCYTPKKDF